MTTIERSLDSLTLLNRADRLLGEMRVYGGHVSVRDALLRHRQMLNEARCHLESAQGLLRTA